jgi:PEP-CTERM motif
MKLRKVLSACAVTAAAWLPMSSAQAVLLIGGDAPSQVAANSIVDIVFAIDTSGSMTDDVASIAAKAASVIENLNCPNTDCYVRARFFANRNASGTVFNEDAYNYINSRNGAALPRFNDTEDNALVVSDLIDYYEWNNDAAPGQNYYRAIVSIGDEGTVNGSPVNADDYQAAYNANQAAIAAGILLFGWVADDPVTPAVGPLFQAMAVGGTVGGFTFGDTGGGYISGPLTDVTVEAQLEDIICDVADGDGGGSVPEPSSLALVALALTGALVSRRRTRLS